MKTADRKIALNTVLLSSTQLLTRVVSIFLVILVARRLGPQMMGIYAFALTFVGLFEVFVNFGMDRYIQREIGRQPDATAPLFARVFALKLIVFLVSAAIILVLCLTIVDSDLKRWVVWLLSLSLFFRANIASNNAFFRGHQKVEYEALVVVSFRLVYGVSGLVAILSGRGLIALAGLELAAQAGACLVSWWLFAWKIAGPLQGMASSVMPGGPAAAAGALSCASLLKKIKEDVKWKGLLELAGTARTFLLIRIVLSIFSSVNMLMLSAMAGDLITGFYSAALRLSSSFDFLSEAFTGSFLPVLSRQITQGWEPFSETFRHYFKYLLMIGLGLAAVLGGLAHNFIMVVFGSAFKPSILTLSILAMALALDFVNLSLSNALISLDKERRIARVFSFGAIFNISLNLLLIPMYKQNGAALAMVVSECLVFVLQIHALGRDRLKSFGLSGISARPLLAAFLAFVFGRVLVSWNLPSAVGFIVLPPAFLLLLILAGALSRGELLAAMSLLPFRKKASDAA